MDFKLENNPGLLYVAATLLPLASFLILLLIGGLRNAFRPYRSSGGVGATLFHVFGGDQPMRIGAYVATAAIAGSFLLSAAGLVWFLKDRGVGHHEHAAVEHEHEEKAEAEEGAEHKHELTAKEDLWADRAEFIRIGSQEHDNRGALKLEVGYRIDHLSAIMFAMVTFVAMLIHLFSAGYMAEEANPRVEDHQVHGEDGGHYVRRGRFSRFFMYLSLFCFSMLNLVLADNLFQIFVSWELVGICSYLLIGFYYERQSASNAANKAFITNRIGDAGFIIGMLILWTYVGTFNFQEIFQRVRAPEADSHNSHCALADQFVRVTPEGE
jgi:NADH-quinone oxidoreductase subunit L